MTSQGELTKEEKEFLSNLDFLLHYRFRWLWCSYHDGCSQTNYTCFCSKGPIVGIHTFVFTPYGRDMRRLLDDLLQSLQSSSDKRAIWYKTFLNTGSHVQKRAIEEEIWSYLDSIGL